MKVYCIYGHHCSSILQEKKKKTESCWYIHIVCIYSSSVYHKVGNENVIFGKLWYAAVVEYVAASHCYELFADLFLL